MDKLISMWKYSIGAFIAAIIMTIGMKGALKEPFLGILIPAIIVGFLVSIWFNKTMGRSPLPQERSRFLWQYGILIAIPFVFFSISAILLKKSSALGITSMIINALVYPFCAEIAFKTTKD